MCIIHVIIKESVKKELALSYLSTHYGNIDMDTYQYCLCILSNRNNEIKIHLKKEFANQIMMCM